MTCRATAFARIAGCMERARRQVLDSNRLNVGYVVDGLDRVTPRPQRVLESGVERRHFLHA